MKYPIFFLLTLLLVLSAEAGAQDIPLKQDNPFIRPVKGARNIRSSSSLHKRLDLKMILNFQSSTIDQQCLQSVWRIGRVSTAFKVVDPQKKRK